MDPQDPQLPPIRSSVDIHALYTEQLRTPGMQMCEGLLLSLLHVLLLLLLQTLVMLLTPPDEPSDITMFKEFV